MSFYVFVIGFSVFSFFALASSVKKNMHSWDTMENVCVDLGVFTLMFWLGYLYMINTWPDKCNGWTPWMFLMHTSVLGVVLFFQVRYVVKFLGYRIAYWAVWKGHTMNRLGVRLNLALDRMK